MDPYNNKNVANANQHVSDNRPMGDSCSTVPAGIPTPMGCATALSPNPRHLIEARIDYHNRQAYELCALLRGLPAEMSREAENALRTLVHLAAPRY